MADDEKSYVDKASGIIPDFFHDIIAYLIPGTIVMALAGLDAALYFSQGKASIKNAVTVFESSYSNFLFFVVIAYVLGRFFEALSYSWIHNSKLLGITNPKYDLIFKDPPEGDYSKPFRENLLEKIKEHLDKQRGEELIAECKRIDKDDFFNVIQFYLRERWPAVAYYEKKQNAVKVTSRSLTLIFAINAVVSILEYIYWLSPDWGHLQLKAAPQFLWILLQIAMMVVFFKRFKIDKKYHAMYIYEAFIATKKLLNKKDESE